jgi:hypothetical protein
MLAMLVSSSSNSIWWIKGQLNYNGGCCFVYVQSYSIENMCLNVAKVASVVWRESFVYHCFIQPSEACKMLMCFRESKQLVASG